MFQFNAGIRTILPISIVVLAFLFIGCHTSGTAISEETSEEKVAVGYGLQDRKTVTGSISHVNPDKELRQITRVEQLLDRIPGVLVQRSPGGGFHVLIRGATSIYGSNEPLYVVDGATVHVDPSRGLYWLNPLDVKSIDVLKDASATAIYGSRGASGVIIIKTRRQ